MHLISLFAIFPLVVSIPLFSQAVPSAYSGGGPAIVVGAGVSNYYTEMFPKHMEGVAVWADCNSHRGPFYLRGFGVEAEVRDLDSRQPTGNNLRLATLGGGPIWTWRRYRKFHPYGKFLIDYGSMAHIKSPGFPSWYTADKWVTGATGGGVEYRAWRNVWVRADYEYQFWRVDWFNTTSFLDPRGFTVGVSYDLKHIHAH